MPTYSYPGPHRLPTREVAVRFYNADGSSWSGSFECARDRHIDVMRWDEAESVVVLAANALYIVDSTDPEVFQGFKAPVEINNAAFDENRARFFVAESLRIRAYGLDRKLLWISESFEGYNAIIRGCMGGVLSVEIDDEDEHSKTVQIRAEDGTIIRWPRFSRAMVAQILRRQSA